MKSVTLSLTRTHWCNSTRLQFYSNHYSWSKTPLNVYLYVGLHFFTFPVQHTYNYYYSVIILCHLTWIEGDYNYFIQIPVTIAKKKNYLIKIKRGARVSIEEGGCISLVYVMRTPQEWWESPTAFFFSLSLSLN